MGVWVQGQPFRGGGSHTLWMHRSLATQFVVKWFPHTCVHCLFVTLATALFSAFVSADPPSPPAVPQGVVYVGQYVNGTREGEGEEHVPDGSHLALC